MLDIFRDIGTKSIDITGHVKPCLLSHVAVNFRRQCTNLVHHSYL
jgi:hypothetical protein